MRQWSQKLLNFNNQRFFWAILGERLKKYLISEHENGQQIFDQLIYISEIINRWNRPLIMMAKLFVFFDSVDLIFHHALNLGSKNTSNENLNPVNSAGTGFFPKRQTNFAIGHKFRMCQPYLLMLFERLGLKQFILDLLEFLKLANDVNLFCVSNESMAQLQRNKIFQHNARQTYAPVFFN